MDFKNREELENHVKRLKAFYNEFYSFLVVMAFSLLVWLLSGGGYFWPVWILAFWGGPIFFKASKLGVLDETHYEKLCNLRDQLPFLKKGWEKDKMSELRSDSSAPAKKSAPQKPKAAPAKKAAAKKPATKSAAVKSPAPKKAATTKATAKKKTATKSVTKKAPAKKAPVKKTPVKKAAPKKK